MNIFNSNLICVLLLALGGTLLGLPGCGQQASKPPAAQQTQALSHNDHGHSHGHDHATVQTDHDEITAELAKLSPEDRALAERQKICPVAEEPLGSMGVPVKLNVAGRDVFICCAACEDSLREEPEKYFSKLDNRE